MTGSSDADLSVRPPIDVRASPDGPESIDHVLARTEHADPMVRADALGRAAARGGPAAARVLCVLLWADANDTVAEAAAAGLARLLDDAPVEERDGYVPDVLLAVGLLSPNRALLLDGTLETIATAVRRALIEHVHGPDETVRAGARRLLQTLVRRVAAAEKQDEPVPGTVARIAASADREPERRDPAPLPTTPGRPRPQIPVTTARVAEESVADILPGLIEQLHDGDDAVRHAVADVLEALPREEVHAHLRREIDGGDPPPDSLITATLTLGFADLVDELVHHVRTPAQLAALRSASSGLRDNADTWAVVARLQAQDRPSTRLVGLALAQRLDPTRPDPILTALADPVAAVRLEAIAALPPEPTDAVLARVLDMIESDTSSSVRMQIVATMGDAPRSTRLIVAERTIAVADPPTRIAALRLLDHPGNDEVTLLSRSLDDPDLAVVAEAARLLADHHAPGSLTILLRALRLADPSRRAPIIDATLRLDPALLGGSILQTLESPDADERAAGIALMATSDAHRADLLPVVHDALVDPAPAVRREALAALARHIDWIDIDRVGERVGDPDPTVRDAAIVALEASQHDGAFRYLLDAMRDADENVRLRARAVLLGRRSRSLVDTLVAALGDANKAPAAVSLLVELGDAALSPLLGSVESAAGRVRRAIGDILREGGLQDRVLAALEDRNPDIRLRAVEALGAMWAGRSGADLTQLVARLGDPVPSVRAATARVLGDIGDLSGVPALLSSREDDPDPDVRRSVANSLAVLGHDELDDLQPSDPAQPVPTRDDQGHSS